MKKLFCFLLAAILCIGCAGCGGETPPAVQITETVPEPAASAPAAAAETAPAVFTEAAETVTTTAPPAHFEGIPAPEGWDQRSLSDEALQKLTKQNSLTAREQIATMADARFYLNLKCPTLWHNYFTMDPQTHIGFQASPETMLAPSYREPLGRPDIANCMMWLLEDDFTIGMLYGLCAELQGGLAPAASANYVFDGSQYVIFDPAMGMDAEPDCRCPGSLNQLIEWPAESLEAYSRIMGAARTTLWKLYAWEGAGEIRFELSDAPRKLEILTPEATLLYHNPEQDSIQIGSSPEKIGQYDLVNYLGGLSLTVEEAKALADADPETVKAEVKTAADVLLYMLAAKITDSHGDMSIFAGGQDWHYNMNAHQVMESRTGNCGSSANLANFLLDGDYEEVGYISQVYNLGGGGGHVYTYILQEGSYYIIDYSWYIFSNYRLTNDFPVMVLDSLEEYGSRFSELYDNVCMVMAYDSPAQDYPCIFGMDNTYYWPADAEFTWLYREESNRAFKFGTKPLPSQVPDWRTIG